MDNNTVKLTAIVSGVIVLLAIVAFVVLRSTTPLATVPAGAVTEVPPEGQAKPPVAGLAGSGQADTGLLPADPALRSGQ